MVKFWLTSSITNSCAACIARVIIYVPMNQSVMVERMRANKTAVDNGNYDDVAGAATASCFTTSGYQNPTLTILALTWRACEDIFRSTTAEPSPV